MSADPLGSRDKKAVKKIPGPAERWSGVWGRIAPKILKRAKRNRIVGWPLPSARSAQREKWPGS